MKGSIFILVIAIIFLSSNVSAVCNLDASLINQDPYPAIPGDYVTIVFQLAGFENPDCKDVYFELIENYPLKLDPGVSASVSVKAGTFVEDSSSYLKIPYKVRIDANALDGNQEISVRYRSSGAPSGTYTIEKLNLNIQDVKTDFEAFIKNYNPITGKITFEILNIGKNDVEALTLYIPSQDNIVVRGTSTNIIGSLDSNDYTTADFDALANNGEINITLTYTDSINERRILKKVIVFDSAPFYNKIESEKKTPTTYYVVGVVIVLAVAYYFYRRHREKKRKALHHHK